MVFSAIPLGAVLSAAAGSPSLPAYTIEARLDAREHTLSGRSRIVFTNPSARPLREAYLHLAPNAYRDRYSIAARESAFYHDPVPSSIPESERGYLDVEQLSVDGEPALFQLLDTTLKVRLPRPLDPGASATLELDWFEKVRRLRGGSGREGAHYEMIDWYPRLAVHDGQGWRAEPVHAVGGRDADFASFEVSLELPADHVVVATGELVGGDAGHDAARARARGSLEEGAPTGEGNGAARGRGRKTVRFRAERAIDFAWVADPALELEESRVGQTSLQVFHRSRSRPDWRQRAMEAARRALEFATRTLGPLPWNRLAVVETLGEESAARCQLALAPGAGEESVARAVLAHAVDGVAGIDGIREAWLGLGLRGHLERRHLVERFGPTGEDPGEAEPVYGRRLRRTPARDRAQQRALEPGRRGRAEPPATVAHQFRDRASFLPAVRDRASLFFDALNGSLGAEVYHRALRAWYAEAAQARTGEARLREVFERESGRDLGELFRVWIHTTEDADLRLVRMERRSTDQMHEAEVELRRKGERATPVDLLFRAVDGSEQRRRWEEGGDRATFVVRLAAPLHEVSVDPEALALDRNRQNNRKPRRFGLVFNWPLQDYAPRDEYVFEWRPSLWYNGIDHGRAGMLLEGSHEQRFHRLKLGASLGLDHGRVDFIAGYSTELPWRRRTELGAKVLKAEGRRLIDGWIRTRVAARAERPPRTWFEAGASSFTVSDASYLRPGRYDLGRINQVWVGLGGEYAGPNWNSETRLRYQAAGHPLQSDYSFSKLSLAARISYGQGTRVTLRSFLGLSTDGDPLPRQERFYLSGEGPMAEYEEAGLRSRDSLLTLLHYHLPGGGNFRGYNDTAVAARRLLAFNLEAERPIWREGRGPLWLERIGRPSLAAFADLAKAEGTGISSINKNALWGLGVGLRLHSRVLGRATQFRLDFPFYLSRPGPDEDGEQQARVSLRWLFSVGSAF